MSSAVIDFQGYRTAFNSLIIKELSIVSISHGSSWHWFFKPPEDIEEEVGHSKTNLWVKKHIHGLEWDYGDIHYEDIKYLLQDATEDFDILWGKGMEKCKFIEELLDKPVYDLHDFGCPNLKQLDNDKIACHFHFNSSLVCSLNQAHRLATWVRENPEAVNFKKEDVRKRTFRNIDSPHHLLSFAGFIKDVKDKIKCVYCGLSYDTKSFINPLRYHKANSPQCLWFKEEEYLQLETRGITMDRMESVLRRLGEQGIETLTTEELSILPRSLLLYLFDYALDYIWDNLPEEWQEDEEFIQKRRLPQ